MPAGVFATEDIEKGQFVTEYKSYKTYSLSERKHHDEEYKKNDEGCYILEVQLPEGQWICLDATRNVDSWARYINHGYGQKANLKMQAVLIDGEWRVALLAKDFISRGSELFYDYGRQKDQPDWMKARPVLEDAPTLKAADADITTIPCSLDNPAPATSESQQPDQKPADNPPGEPKPSDPKLDDPKPNLKATSESQEPGHKPTDNPPGELKPNDAKPGHNCKQCNGYIKTPSVLCRDCGIICDKCSDLHTRISIFSKHLLVPAESLEQLIPVQCCSQCASTSATTYCKTCKDYICQMCVEQHGRLYIFLKHKLLPVTECPMCGKEKAAFGNHTICLKCINPRSVSNITT